MATSLPPLAIPGQRLGPTSSYSAGPGTHILKTHIYASIAGPVVVSLSQKVQSNNMRSKGKSILTVSRSFTQQVPTQKGGPSWPQQQQQQQNSVNPVPVPVPVSNLSRLKYNTLPAVDSIVLARVTRVQKRQATVSILVVLDNVPNPSPNPNHQNSSQPTPITTPSDNDNINRILANAANPENHSNTDDLRFQALIRKEDVRAVEKDRVVMDEMFRVGDIVRGTVISLGDQSYYYLSTARNDLGVVMARSEGGDMMFPVSWREMRDPVSGVGELRKVARPF